MAAYPICIGVLLLQKIWISNSMLRWHSDTPLFLSSGKVFQLRRYVHTLYVVLLLLSQSSRWKVLESQSLASYSYSYSYQLAAAVLYFPTRDVTRLPKLRLLVKRSRCLAAAIANRLSSANNAASDPSRSPTHTLLTANERVPAAWRDFYRARTTVCVLRSLRVCGLS